MDIRPCGRGRFVDLALSLLVLWLGACGEEGPADPARPHVVLLVMDTTRGDRCSVNGYARPTTPQLEKIAEGGTVYRNAWSPAGWTGPAHASLFTGLHPERHGYLRGVRSYLDTSSVTLAEQFRDAGYRTACLTNNNTIAPENGLVQGFELFSAFYADRDRPYPWAPATHRVGLDWAISAHRKGESFFLFINDMEPHYPYSPPDEFARRFRSAASTPDAEARARELRYEALFGHNCGADPLPPDTLAAISDLYDAEIACLDEAIGRLVLRLREEGILDRTLLVVTSDHGENLGDHDLVDHTFSLHRTICHVPLVVRYPPRFAAGTVVDDVVRLEDVPPTLLEICSLPVPDDLDGRSLLADIPGRVSRAALDHPDRFLDRMRRDYPKPVDDRRLRADLRATFDGRHHTIRYSDGRVETYDVPMDAAELHNITSEGGTGKSGAPGTK